MDKSVELKSLSFHKKIIQSFLEQDQSVDGLLIQHFDIKGIEKSIENKFLSPQIRKTLVKDLIIQYSSTEVNPAVSTNINLLKDARSFTVTTGHQLNLFTGPLYSLIKICQTIALSKSLKSKYPGYNFIPVYWMATEDHDIEEINHMNVFNKKIIWETNYNGVSGELNPRNIENLKPILSELFKNNDKVSAFLIELFEIYSSSIDLAQAHRRLIHKLIPDEGLVIVDANSKNLKSLFTNQILKELEEQTCFKNITETNNLLQTNGFHVQINPRDICLFYQRENYRVRLTKSESGFKTIDEKFNWSGSQLKDEVKANPERFSPNACFRPVYQELILPNLAYIGGPGEISYWLQLKSTFEQFKVDFPTLILRNSFLFLTQKQFKVLSDAKLEIKEIFDQPERVVSKANSQSLELDFEQYKSKVGDVLNDLSSKLEQLNINAAPQVSAANQNIQKQLSNLNKKILNVSKAKNEVQIKRLEKVLNDVYPNQILKERKSNFLELLNQYSIEELISKLIEKRDFSTPKLIVQIK